MALEFHKDLVGIELHIARADQATGSPVGVVTPGIVGQLYHDDATGNIWIATGLTDTDWLLSGGVATPASSVVAEQLFDQSVAVGTGTDYARDDHTHGTPTSATVAAATDYDGRFEAPSIGTGDITLNHWGWWWDTVNLQLFQVRNRAGALYFVEANPL